ncbi:MAG: hypothetical protein PHE06_12160 [Lachnospiraceae bacterium]|nr:hypothetical protein [Lachnospiraceae bacterium]
MKKNRTDSELSRILQEDIKIPEKVQQRIGETCRELEQRENGEKIIFMAKRRKLKVAVTAAALCGVISIGVMAATGVFSWNKVEEDNTTKYEIKLDKEAVAHDLIVTPTYAPEGYTKNEATEESEDEFVALMLEGDPELDEAELRKQYQERRKEEDALQPNSQFISYEKRDADGNYIGGYGIEVYNATKLDNIISTWNGTVFEYKNVSSEEETKIQGLDTRIFTWKDASENGSILMFNPIEGYMIQINWGYDGTDTVSVDEMKKVAEGLDIKMLDTELAYLPVEEREKINETKQSEQQAWKEEAAAERNAGVDGVLVKNIGDSLTVGNIYGLDENVEVAVTEVRISDSLSLEEYDSSHFNRYEEQVAPAMNEDGTIKPHGRKVTDLNTGEQTEETGVNSKYVIVKVHEKNNAQEETPVSTPFLMPLKKTESGNYAYLEKDYSILDVDFMLEWQTGMLVNGSDSVYCSEETNYQEKKAETVWGEHTLAAGEEKDVTLVYIMDEDLLENMVLTYAIDMKDKFVDISQK